MLFLIVSLFVAPFCQVGLSLFLSLALCCGALILLRRIHMVSSTVASHRTLS